MHTGFLRGKLRGMSLMGIQLNWILMCVKVWNEFIRLMRGKVGGVIADRVINFRFL
jgi:hypothetical protein